MINMIAKSRDVAQRAALKYRLAPVEWRYIEDEYTLRDLAIGSIVWKVADWDAPHGTSIPRINGLLKAAAANITLIDL